MCTHAIWHHKVYIYNDNQQCCMCATPSTAEQHSSRGAAGKLRSISLVCALHNLTTLSLTAVRTVKLTLHFCTFCTDKYGFTGGLWEVPVVLLQTFCLASERLIYMVGILIYRILCLSLRCDSWYATML